MPYKTYIESLREERHLVRVGSSAFEPEYYKNKSSEAKKTVQEFGVARRY